MKKTLNLCFLLRFSLHFTINLKNAWWVQWWLQNIARRFQRLISIEFRFYSGLKNSIETYIFTIIRVNQWEIFAKEFTADFDSGQKDAVHIQNDLLYISFFKDFARCKTS